MSRGKRFSTEQIVRKLREADVWIGQGLEHFLVGRMEYPKSEAGYLLT